MAGTVDSHKLERGCVIHAGFPLFVVWGWRTVMFQLCGLYSRLLEVNEPNVLSHKQHLHTACSTTPWRSIVTSEVMDPYYSRSSGISSRSVI